jgi:hypothetical protein
MKKICNDYKSVLSVSVKVLVNYYNDSIIDY